MKINLKELLNELDNELSSEGRDQRGVQDGTGPFKGSAMAAAGRKGPGAGRGLGKCPKEKDYDTKKEYEKALKKWKKEQKD